MTPKPIVATTVGSCHSEIVRILISGGCNVITLRNRGELSRVRNATHLLLGGGADIHPSLYGQSVSYARGFDPQRDWLEFQLARYAINRGMPTLGLCRGCQMLAVAAGGLLWQDYATQKETAAHTAKHEVRTARNSIMRDLIGSRIEVNSYHHQAVTTAPKGWRATAWSMPDDIIEAIEHSTKPLLGVQFHPEMMFDQKHPAGENLILNWLDGDIPKESRPYVARTLPLFA